MVIDVIISFILGLLLAYILVLLYKPYQYQIVEYTVEPEVIKYVKNSPPNYS